MEKNFKKSAKVLDIRIDFYLMEEMVKKIIDWLRNKGEEKKYLVTPNPEIITYAQKDNEFKKILNQADLAIPDGNGILWAMDILGKKRDRKERLTGTDLMLELCRLAAKYGWRIGLMGGGEEVAERAAETLRKKYPGINIVFSESGGKIGKYGEGGEYGGGERIDILFVAFGFPKQEYWIFKNKNTFPAKVFIPVGGAFDYISGKVKRAPEWMRYCGLEWLYRLICEPRRIKRQIIGAKFFFLVLLHKFKRMKNE